MTPQCKQMCHDRTIHKHRCKQNHTAVVASARAVVALAAFLQNRRSPTTLTVNRCVGACSLTLVWLATKCVFGASKLRITCGGLCMWLGGGQRLATGRYRSTDGEKPTSISATCARILCIARCCLPLKWSASLSSLSTILSMQLQTTQTRSDCCWRFPGGSCSLNAAYTPRTERDRCRVSCLMPPRRHA